MITSKIVFVNLIWKFAERCGSQMISLIVSIILARILSPDDYGTVAMCMVFIVLLQVFADSGLGVALIQKKESDNKDFSTVFFTNVVLACAIYAFIWILAPFIAEFYSMNGLIWQLRSLSLLIIVNAFRNVQQAYVSKHMMFKYYFLATLSASVASAFIGISMAYTGYGVWSLIAQQLSHGIINTLILWCTVSWRPQCIFSISRLKELYSFGWKMLASTLISSGYDQLWQLIIGKKYSPSDLAFFNQGQKFPQVIVSNINSSIDSVLFPAMSDIQNNYSRLKDMTRRAIKTSIFIMAPMMLVIVASAQQIVTLLLTEKWLPCVPFLCVFCFNYMFWPVHTTNLNAIKALGRSDLFLRLEIIKAFIGVCILIYTMQISVMAMAYGTIVSGICSQLINSWPNRKLLGYGYLQQLRDFLPSILLAVLASAVSWGTGYAGAMLPLPLVLALQILVGAAVYLVLCHIFHLEELQYMWQLLKSFRNRG